MTVLSIFKHCVEAIRANDLIERESAKDKEFHFQNWFERQLRKAGLHYEQGGRNSYPDFSIVQKTDGYELKGLAYPGRDANFDSNSQVPTGYHNGRTIYYVFGRYPKKPDGDKYPVMDLVVCHGDFLNADHAYVHKNKNIKAFGSYGDIMIRDRKMYVVPTPFHLVEGTAHHRTLILPAQMEAGDEFTLVGELKRMEASEIIVGYSFDLRTNALVATKVKNPSAGREHKFCAWRLKGEPMLRVAMRKVAADGLDAESEEEAGDD